MSKMKIDASTFRVKLKKKIPCENESKLAQILVNNMAFLDEITEEVLNIPLEEIKEKKKLLEEEFMGLSREYSDLFRDYAKIRMKANELYSRNRTVALTMSVLRLNLMTLRDQGIEISLPYSYDEAIKKVEYFIYRYITKKEDKRLVEQVVFKER